jgi:C-terminal processing protease CtpA/Prc
MAAIVLDRELDSRVVALWRLTLRTESVNPAAFTVTYRSDLSRDRQTFRQARRVGLGTKPFHGCAVMLVNEHTASAAEMVAGFASERRLATIVGTCTSGQVLGGANFSVGHDFMLRLPAAVWHTWDGRTLEGCGVEPDITAAVDPVALAAGCDTQLETALEAARHS